MRSRLAVISAATLTAAVALAASAQPAGHAARALAPAHIPARAQTGEVLHFYYGGLSNLTASQKDQGLRALLAAVPDRLIELAQFSGAENPDPDKIIPPLWTLLDSPMTLRVASRDGAEDGGPPVSIALTSRPADAAALNRQIGNLLRDADFPTRAVRGGREFDTPLGPGWVGPVDNTLSLSVGGDMPQVPVNWDLPDGYTPVLGFHANFRNAQPLFDMAFASAPDEDQADQMRTMFEQSGIMGDDALIVTVAVGTKGESSVVRGLVEDVRPRAAALGLPEDASLGRDFLALIPADATMVQAGVMTLKSVEQILEVSEVAEGFEQVNEQLGFDLMNDLVLQVGGRFATYQSNTTGGGGILSTVAIVEIKDPARFARAHERLVGMANDLIEQQMASAPAPMSVQVASRTVEGQKFFSLALGGLPIPAEISWTIHKNHLIAALSPRALIEAMKQADGAPSSFAQSRVLADITSGIAPGDLLSVSYTDTPRFAVQGYSVVTLLCSALSNAVQTQGGSMPPVALPPFNDFIAGVQPNTMTTYWDGDDIRIRGSGNASVLVNAAGSSTALLIPAMVGGSMGALMPAMERARDSARQVKASANLRNIGMAFHMYAADNRDRCPTSLDDLLPYLEGMDMTSPLGPCYDGSPDYAVRSDLPRTLDRIEYPSQTMIAIDRASIINGSEHVIVCFADGAVQSMFSWEFSDMLAQDQNRGAFESFSLPDWMNPGF